MTLTKLSLVFIVAAAGCTNSVHSDADAQKAYLGLDASIDKAINLGFDGFNAASSANIPTQMTTGTKTGTLVVDGHVDQGSSSNKTMNLNTTYTMYSDDGKVTYDTMATAPPLLSMGLKNFPDGTVTGNFDGVFTMSGDLHNSVTLTLAFSGNTMAGPNNTVIRVAGTTHITGTAVSDYGTYNVDVTR